MVHRVGMIHRFGGLELDLALFELRRGGKAVKMEPRVFDVLAYLVEHRDRVVSKEELIGALWPGEAVSDSVLPRCIAAARRAVTDSRKEQRVIQTVYGRGYRFVATLEEDADAPARTGAAASDASPFVGRSAVLEQLRSRLSRSRSGAGQVVLLAGEPGIGKTRTAAEVERFAREEGMRVLHGHGFEAEAAPAFWLWTQVLREAITDVDPEQLVRAAGSGAPDLHAVVPEMPREPGEEPTGAEGGQQARFRLFQSVTDLLVRLAEQTPLLLILDDLHWADADSLLLLQFVAPRIREAPILLIGGYRDVEVRREHALAGTLANLAREPHCQRIDLRGLDTPAIETMIETVAGTPMTAELARSIEHMTAGNPFFVRELTRLLAHEGKLDLSAAEDWSLVLPQGVRDVIGRRLDSISAACNEVLRSAAAFTRDFSVPLLAEVLEQDRALLLERIDEALGARILVESQETTGHYAFAHALVRQTLYLELSTPQRLAIHRRIGLALERAHGAHVRAHLAELAYHFIQAAPLGETERAVRYCIAAGEHAHQRHAYHEAARHYERALEVLDLDLESSDALRCDILLALGESLMHAGQPDRARTHYGEAAGCARAMQRPDLLGRAALGHCGPSGMVAPVDSRGLLEEALDRLEDDGDAGLRARILSKLVQTPSHWSRMEARDELSRRAHALALRSGDGGALVEALGARWWACLGPDRIEDRIAIARELRESPHAEGPRAQLLALDVMRSVHLIRGELDRALQTIESSAAIARRIRQPFWGFFAATGRASLAISRGEFDVVEEMLDESLVQGRDAVPFADAIVLGQQFMLHAARGDELPDWKIERDLGGLAVPFDAVSRLIEASVLQWKLGSGEAVEVRGRYEQLAAHDFADFEKDENWLLTMRAFAELAGMLSDAPRAARLDALLEPYAGLFVGHELFGVVLGSVASVRASLAITCGRLDDSVALAERAIDLETAAGLVPGLLWSRARLAGALERRGGAGDLERARDLRARLARDARAIGSRHDFARTP
jgi:DNA-binding winged helix-turn-helix (wHTH) protein/tetratricopeptide (TPR) repeat protein